MGEAKQAPGQHPAVCCQPESKEWKAGRRILPGKVHMLPWHVWDQGLWEGNLPTELSPHLQQGKDSKLG